MHSKLFTYTPLPQEKNIHYSSKFAWKIRTIQEITGIEILENVRITINQLAQMKIYTYKNR